MSTSTSMSSATACERLRSRLRWARIQNDTRGTKFPGCLETRRRECGCPGMPPLRRAAACRDATTRNAGFAPYFLTEYGGRHFPDIRVSQDLVTWTRGECLFFKRNLKMCATSQTPDNPRGVLPRDRTNALRYDTRRSTDACCIVAQNEQPRRRSASKTPDTRARIRSMTCGPNAGEKARELHVSVNVSVRRPLFTVRDTAAG